MAYESLLVLWMVFLLAFFIGGTIIGAGALAFAGYGVVTTALAALVSLPGALREQSLRAAVYDRVRGFGLATIGAAGIVAVIWGGVGTLYLLIERAILGLVESYATQNPDSGFGSYFLGEKTDGYDTWKWMPRTLALSLVGCVLLIMGMPDAEDVDFSPSTEVGSRD